MNQATVYDALADHQISESRWGYQWSIRELQRWREIFNVEFKLELTPTALKIGGTRSGCYGHFRASPNEFGLAREIAFDEFYLRAQALAGDFWQTLGTLLHELLHAWQHDHGQPGRRNYHNLEFRLKAASLGLNVCRRGTQQYTTPSPFLELMQRYGVTAPVIPENVVPVIERPGSKLKKWSCGCTNVRVAIADFRAQCLKCGHQFSRQS